MDVLMQSIADFKENSLMLNDLKNQQKTTSDRLDNFFEAIWQVFSVTKAAAVPNNAWNAFEYKGFKIKGSKVRIIGNDPYSNLDDRTITIPLQIINNGPASVGSFIAHKVVKDVHEAAERQKREDMEALADHMQKSMDDLFLKTLTNTSPFGMWPLSDGGAFIKFRRW